MHIMVDDNLVHVFYQMMAELTQMLPPYQFLVAFSQLVSRVTHPNADVFSRLEVTACNSCKQNTRYVVHVTYC